MDVELAVDMANAVSYTHLDVYKRQGHDDLVDVVLVHEVDDIVGGTGNPYACLLYTSASLLLFFHPLQASAFWNRSSPL